MVVVAAGGGYAFREFAPPLLWLSFAGLVAVGTIIVVESESASKLSAWRVRRAADRAARARAERLWPAVNSALGSEGSSGLLEFDDHELETVAELAERRHDTLVTYR